MEEEIEFKDFVGKIFTDIKLSEDKCEIYFTENNGVQYQMYHNQDCCESVYVEDIIGDLEDLLNTPILKASEDTNSENNPHDIKRPVNEFDGSFTWTFYNIATIKGSVTIRWYGSSNGYYSESVDIIKL